MRLGVRKDYVPDPLGSTVALLDNTQAVTDSWEYWPYGETRSGSSATPFRFIRALGYYSSERTYVRARHYRQNLGRWQTEDSLWPTQVAYEYGRSSPASNLDPAGTCPFATKGCTVNQRNQICWSWKYFCDSFKNDFVKCLDKTGFPCSYWPWPEFSDMIEGLCNDDYSVGSDKGTTIEIKCDQGGIMSEWCCKDKGCACSSGKHTIVFCQKQWTSSTCPTTFCQILHELVHLGRGKSHPAALPTPGGTHGDAWACPDGIPSCEKWN